LRIPWIPIITLSAGVPDIEYISVCESLLDTITGAKRERLLPTPLCCISGATIIILPSPFTAAAAAFKPGESMPSSLTIRMVFPMLNPPC
jgi:hypothetical protein|tara:strand:- start:7943 stop:8212 length:270 start_codon:yes stop_codon:yes gene_type:complete